MSWERRMKVKILKICLIFHTFHLWFWSQHVTPSFCSLFHHMNKTDYTKEKELREDGKEGWRLREKNGMMKLGRLLMGKIAICQAWKMFHLIKRTITWEEKRRMTKRGWKGDKWSQFFTSSPFILLLQFSSFLFILLFFPFFISSSPSLQLSRMWTLRNINSFPLHHPILFPILTPHFHFTISPLRILLHRFHYFIYFCISRKEDGKENNEAD